MRQIGKQGKLWRKARAKLIKEALAEGRIEIINDAVQGICEDCKKWKYLTPDHIIKRGRGGGHNKSNIEWVCTYCHNLRDNMGDPKKKKPKSKKAGWAKPHRCKGCRKQIGGYLVCPLCERISV